MPEPTIGKTELRCEMDSVEAKRAEAGRKKLAAQSWSQALSAYVPKLTDPVKILCVNLHIFQDATGGGHYQSTEMARLRSILDWTNGCYLAVAPPTYSPNPSPQFDFGHTHKVQIEPGRVLSGSGATSCQQCWSLSAGGFSEKPDDA